MEKKELKERLDVFRHAELPRLRRLGAYYAGRHAILEESKDPGKPDNRLVCNFCQSITDSTVGYFMGIPVSYDATDEETLAEIAARTGLHEGSVRRVLRRLRPRRRRFQAACRLRWDLSSSLGLDIITDDLIGTTAAA